ncbi:Nose resistant to fluoxetine protein 6 [Trichinella britovi]|uniref:Nose resistant to fluoxetine protein 6 n=1 Tax=Trichinella britovi TaxID=45882 RepID=A0A0V1D0Y7_TRIBR|nr:Nose resistant to fluoxetine protein 6 [Trichinella britovi]
MPARQCFGCWCCLLLLLTSWFHGFLAAPAEETIAVPTLGLLFTKLKELASLLNKEKLMETFQQTPTKNLTKIIADQFQLFDQLTSIDNDQRFLSAQCLSDLIFLVTSLKKVFETNSFHQHPKPTDPIDWTLKVIDSFGKIPTGILHGNYWMLGNYEECIAISVPSTQQELRWEGKYCLYEVKFHEELISLEPKFSNFSGKCNDNLPAVRFGACLPSSCTREDATILGHKINNTLQGIACKFSVNCHEREYVISKDPEAVVAIILLLALLAFIVFSTLYDICVFQNQQKMVPSSATCVIESRDLTEPQCLVTRAHSQAPDKPTLEKQHGFVKILLAFSLRNNAKKLFSMKTSAGQITCLNGIRVLSMCWIIFGHTYYWAIPYINNVIEAYKLPDNIFNQVLLNASLSWHLAVLHMLEKDEQNFNLNSIAFILGTVFLSPLSEVQLKALYCKKKKKSNNFCENSFARVTPVYMAVLALHAVLTKYVSSGPLWDTEGFDRESCAKSWWTNALYLNNFLNLDDECMTWTWYMANDMQFFILSVPLLVLYLKREKLAIIITTLIIAISCVINIVILDQNPDWPPIAIFSVNPKQFDIVDVYWDKVYIKPYTRCGPFLIGLLFGYYLHKIRLVKKLPKVAVGLCWTACTGTALLVLFGLYDYSKSFEITYAAKLMYGGLARIAWAIVLAWITFACTAGYAAPLNDFLSWKIWIPLSRLTYSAYLVHPILIRCYYASQNKPLHYNNNYQMAHYFLGHLLFSFLLALVVNLTLEAPFQVLESFSLNTKDRSIRKIK